MKQAKTPNILFLFSDQHSARVLGCYGDPVVRTPNLDRLASRGVRLERAYAQSPICTPSRMCFASGQYAHNHGFFGLMGPRPQALPSLFTVTREAGYRNAIMGKIHTPAGWLEKDCEEVYEARDRDHRFLPGMEDPTKLDACPSPLAFAETSEGRIARKSVDFMRAAVDSAEPFCLWMSLPRPHQAYSPAREFWDLYLGDAPPLPPNAGDRLEGRSLAARETAAFFQNETEWMAFDPREWEAARRRVLQGYYACVSQVDAAVGRVLTALEEMGVSENTLIVYSSDHGEFAGEHGLIEKAPGIGFHCVTRIPMIWSWPGRLPQKRAWTSLVESVDFLPTVCRLLGLDDPDWVDGIDISGLLKNGNPVRSFAFTEHPLSKTIHSEHHKLTLYLPEMNGGQAHGELFDLRADPWELENRYADESFRETRDRLSRELYEWLVRSSRHQTVNPRTPASAPGGAGPWCPRREPPLYGRDGKVDPSVVGTLVGERKINYL